MSFYKLNKNAFCAHQGGKTHSGGVINKCKHPDRGTLNGKLTELFFSPRGCIMSVYDDIDYCPLFKKITVLPPPPPSATKIIEELIIQNAKNRKNGQDIK